MTSTLLVVALNLYLTVLNICFSLYLKKKGADLWWLNILAATFGFLIAVFKIINIL